MFTGIVAEIGEVAEVQRTANGLRWTIHAPQCASQLKKGDSISVVGACQTVESVTRGRFSGTAIPETLKKTTFARWRVGQRVNLELALRADGRFGGHIVSGHVDTVGSVSERRDTPSGYDLAVAFPAAFARWTLPQGSIAIDGVSLTIATVMQAGRERGALKVALIPETLARTTLGALRTGDPVNIEFDQIVKAVVQNQERLQPSSGRIDEALLARTGGKDEL